MLWAPSMQMDQMSDAALWMSQGGKKKEKMGKAGL